MGNLQKIISRNFKLINFLTLLVFFGNGCLYSQDKRSKTNSEGFRQPFFHCWDYSAGQNQQLEFASDNVKSLFLPTLDGKVVSLDYDSGEKRWETDLGGEIISAPFSDANSVYIVVYYQSDQNKQPDALNNQAEIDRTTASQEKTVIRSLDKTTGLTKWEAKSQFDYASEEKVYLYGFQKFLILVTDSGDIHSINRFTGQISWKKSLNLKFSSIPFQEEDKIFFGTSDNRVISVSMTTGEIIRAINTSTSPTAVVYDKIQGNLIWGDKRGTVYSLNPGSKKLNWSIRRGAEISSVVLTERGVLFTSLDNFVYLISYKKGQLVWKRRLDSRVVAKPLVNGNLMIATSISEATAFVIELGSGKVVNNISLEPDNLFTGGYVKAGNLLIYSTLKGISAFSQKADCQLAAR